MSYLSQLLLLSVQVELWLSGVLHYICCLCFSVNKNEDLLLWRSFWSDVAHICISSFQFPSISLPDIEEQIVYPDNALSQHPNQKSPQFQSFPSHQSRNSLLLHEVAGALKTLSIKLGQAVLSDRKDGILAFSGKDLYAKSQVQLLYCSWYITFTICSHEHFDEHWFEELHEHLDDH